MKRAADSVRREPAAQPLVVVTGDPAQILADAWKSLQVIRERRAARQAAGAGNGNP